MSTSKAFTGQGTIFNRGSSSVSEINSITGPGKSRDTIDVTRLEDTDGYRQFIGGLRNPGTVTLNMNYTPEGYILLNGDFENDELVEYSIQLPAGKGTFTFNGLVTEVPVSIPIGDKVTVDVTIQISGAVAISDYGD